MLNSISVLVYVMKISIDLFFSGLQSWKYLKQIIFSLCHSTVSSITQRMNVHKVHVHGNMVSSGQHHLILNLIVFVFIKYCHISI